MHPKIFFKSFFQPDLPLPMAGNCFVAMPFAEGFNIVYSSIKEAMESDELGFRCHRADEEFAGGYVMETVLRQLQEAEIVIADLTGRNANVFYELGIAHTVKDARCIVLISQDEIPFDVRAYRCHKYDPSKLKSLEQHLMASVKEITPARSRIVRKIGESYENDDPVLGDGDDFYRFSISVLDIADKAVKLRLEVWPNDRFDERQPVIEQTLLQLDGQGMNKAKIPMINYAVRLHTAGRGQVEFCICDPRSS